MKYRARRRLGHELRAAASRANSCGISSLDAHEIEARRFTLAGLRLSDGAENKSGIAVYRPCITEQIVGVGLGTGPATRVISPPPWGPWFSKAVAPQPPLRAALLLDAHGY